MNREVWGRQYKGPIKDLGFMPVTVYRDPSSKASLAACGKLRMLGLRFVERPITESLTCGEEMDLVKALWRAADRLPVIRVGDHEFYDYPSALRRLSPMTNQRKAAAQEG
jgi:hypothetical protein